MKIQNVKGGYDFLPKEQKIRNYINGVLKETFMEYGYTSIETPILCYLDMLVDKYDENNDLLKEIYKLSDQGGRELGLRYDLTVPFAKFIALNKNNITMPFKRYEIGKVFRDGPVKLGRAREFYQCDVDACGVESPYAEIEYFMMSKEVFKEFNLDVEIRYNNRKFLSGLLEYVSVPKENIGAFITLIDKLDKLTRDDIESELEELSSKEVVDKVFKYFEYDLEMLTSELGNTNVELLTEGINELNSLDKLIKDLNLDLCKFTPFLARGLEIYTGTVWEIFDKTGEFKSALGGGGRYDKIITNFLHNGEEYPAIGMSFGLEPMYTLLKEREYMKTDIREEVNKYIMEIDLPGLKKEDILINYENGYLTIKAVKKVELKTEVYVRRERFYGEVKRSFYIGEKKESDIKANYENGILTISFPKEEIPKKEIPNITIK